MEIFAPAKINLFLEVTSKRSDGYHELFTLMCPVGLYDRLEFAFTADDISVSCSHPDVPNDASNLAYRAAELFLKTADIKENVSIKIEKKIPVAAGLGGGSSDAAAVLKGLNQHFNQPFSDSELSQMGQTLGADVPFFIFGHPALATGIGELLEPFDKMESLHALIIYPRIKVSTAEVYQNLNLRLTKCKKQLKNLRFKKYDFDVTKHLCNDLETYTAKRFPVIEEAKKTLKSCGAIGSLMSGSGPSVFGLFRDVQDAQRAHQQISQLSKWVVFSAELLR